jgi:SAM-dependent methyltransferase
MKGCLYRSADFRIIGKNYMELSRAGLRALDMVHSRLASQPDNVEVLCPCGVGDDVIVTLTDRNGLPCRLVLCRSCGLIRMNPRPSDAHLSWFYSECYRDLYDSRASSPDVWFEKKLWKGGLVERALKAGQVDIGKGTVLDVGCGGGWTLMPFFQEGCACVGYDYDKRLLEMGRSRGLTLRFGGPETAENDGVRANLVICGHVLEHVIDPTAYLARLKTLLLPSGCLYLEVPHTRRIGDRHKGDSLRYWQRAHLWDFQRDHLFVFLLRAGFEPIWFGDDENAVFVLAEARDKAVSASFPLIGERVESELLAYESSRTSLGYFITSRLTRGFRRIISS